MTVGEEGGSLKPWQPLQGAERSVLCAGGTPETEIRALSFLEGTQAAVHIHCAPQCYITS